MKRIRTGLRDWISVTCKKDEKERTVAEVFIYHWGYGTTIDLNPDQLTKLRDNIQGVLDEMGVEE